MKKVEVYLVGTDDGWDGIYINGVAVYQDHHISIRDFMAVLAEHNVLKGVVFKSGFVAGREANEEVQANGALPNNLAEILVHVD